MLYLVDQVLRRTILSNATAGEEGMAFGLPAMSPQDAMETLMRPLVMEGTARDVATGYVRHDNTHRARYNTSRTYAIGSTVKEQYEEAAHKWSVGMRQCEHACTPACLHACVRACHRVFFFVAAAKKYDLTSISLAPPPPITTLLNAPRRTNSRGLEEALWRKKRALTCLRWRHAVERVLAGTIFGFTRNPHVREGYPVAIADVAETEQQVVSLRPYVALLKRTIAVGGEDLAASVCDQSGFKTLIELEEGKEVTCGICMAPVSDPTVTRCLHIACGKCLLTWLDASQVLNHTAGAPHAHPQHCSAPCPLCRQEFTAQSLIRIKVNRTQPGEGRGGEEGAGGSGGSGKGSGKGKGKGKGEGEEEGEHGVSRYDLDGAIPRILPPVEAEDYMAGVLPPVRYDRDPRYPALNRHLGFLGHHGEIETECKPAAKFAFIIKKIRKMPGEKLVVFSQFESSLRLLSKVRRARAPPSLPFSFPSPFLPLSFPFPSLFHLLTHLSQGSHARQARARVHHIRHGHQAPVGGDRYLHRRPHLPPLPPARERRRGGPHPDGGEGVRAFGALPQSGG